MKVPRGKLALAYRSLAVAEERAERFMAERDALQVLLNERDAQLDQLGQVLGEVLAAAGMIRGDRGLSGPQLLQFGREFCENLDKAKDERPGFEVFFAEKAKSLPLLRGATLTRYPGGQYVNDWALFGHIVWNARAALK